MNNIKNLYLLCKSGANLCMCQLTIKSQNSTSLINSIIDIISKEEDINKQLLCIKYLNNILFKVNSLQMNNTLNNNYNNDNFGNQNGNEYNYINQLFIESFDNFLATNKIENWINSLNIIYNKIQELNDKSGIIIARSPCRGSSYRCLFPVRLLGVQGFLSHRLPRIRVPPERGCYRL